MHTYVRAEPLRHAGAHTRVSKLPQNDRLSAQTDDEYDRRFSRHQLDQGRQVGSQNLTVQP